MTNSILDQRPSVIEVHRPELLEVSAELKARGAIIHGTALGRFGTCQHPSGELRLVMANVVNQGRGFLCEAC